MMDEERVEYEVRPASSMTLDGATGAQMEEYEEATWEALCEPPPVKSLVIDFGPNHGKLLVKYRPFLSFERHQQLSRKFKMDDPAKRDSRGFMIAVLADVLTAPRVTTPQHERMLGKANFAILNQILLDVVGAESKELEAVRDDLGN
ncbi:MAG: hypothetical protein JW940_27340 [Polyangiaceae bacterium]|nr:hypothetical protein [Polyangiaceae bacterium]